MENSPLRCTVTLTESARSMTCPVTVTSWIQQSGFPQPLVGGRLPLIGRRFPLIGRRDPRVQVFLAGRGPELAPLAGPGP